jgi:hypothetical protein
VKFSPLLGVAFFGLGNLSLRASDSSANPSPFLTQTAAAFSQWDADGDGTLSQPEIERAVADSQYRGETAAAVVALRRAIRGKDYQLPPLTREGLAGAVPKPKDAPKAPDFDALYTTALGRIQKAQRELWSGPPVTLNVVGQGKLGDCFCLAPLGAMLHRDPQEVARMFSLEADGKVAVTFGGGQRIAVNPPTDAELALLASTEGTGVWANCYEKAVGQTRLKANDKTYPTEVSAVARGGSAGTMLSFVTGREIERFSCKPFREKTTTEEKKQELLGDLRARLSANVQARRLICGGTSSGTTPAGHKPPGIRGGHAYAILGYDAANDAVTLWDPHGDTFKPKGEPGLVEGYPRSEGRAQIPLTDLVQFFGGFSFETERAVTAAKE